MTHPGDHHRSARGHSAAFNDDRLAAALEADGELAAGLTDQAIALCTDLLDVDSTEVRRVVDVGCGPGVATSSLAEAFGSAMVVAVDRSPVCWPAPRIAPRDTECPPVWSHGRSI